MGRHVGSSFHREDSASGLIGCVDLRLGKGPLDFYNLLIATAVMAYVPLRDWLRVRSVHFLSARGRTFKP